MCEVEDHKRGHRVRRRGGGGASAWLGHLRGRGVRQGLFERRGSARGIRLREAGYLVPFYFVSPLGMGRVGEVDVLG
jgi:hypothetical protein